MSLIKISNQHTKTKPIIVLGNTAMDKMKRAMSFVSDSPIIMYANEYDITDNFSIPKDIGIIIDEMHYKPNTDLIRRTILEYAGQVVLITDSKKAVPTSIYNLCDMKRPTEKLDVLNISPRADEPINYDLDMFTLVREYLTNRDRDEVALKLKINTPADNQILSWIVPNIHPNKIAFIDNNVKRRWDSSYFYELLAYSHNGKLSAKMVMPTRRKYSKLGSIASRLGLRRYETYLLQDLLKDDKFKKYAMSKLDNSECRLLKLGEKRKIESKKVVLPSPTLDKWL